MVTITKILGEPSKKKSQKVEKVQKGGMGQHKKSKSL